MKAKPHTFRLSRFMATAFSLLLLFTRIQNFGRSESFDGQRQGIGDAAPENQHANEHPGSVSESEDEPEDLYFYLFDKDSVVTEVSRLPTKNDEEEDEPDFLYHPQPGHIRIVEFYAHWCPHCLHFRPNYNAFAKKMMEIAERTKLKIDVYAVSCVPHRSVCRDFDITGYPRIKLFIGAEDDEGIDISHRSLHPFVVLKNVAEKTGTDVSDAYSMVTKDEEQQRTEILASRNQLENNDSFWIRKTQYDTYCDVYLSFQFAMQHGIFVGIDPPNEKAKEDFEKWIFLLNNVLPPSWPLHAMISEIADDIETVLDSEENLLKIIDKHPPPRKNWSQSCSRGVAGMGYTCGLWELFHTTALGVVEWNLNNIGNLFYKPKDVGYRLRNYIDHFFGCEVCRTNFLQEYDHCGFQSCERLTTEVGSLDDWKELPLWLFELHNGVNIRLTKEKAERENRDATQEELTAVDWPAKNDCPLCWRTDGSFHPDAVFSFLQLSYWPGELFSSDERRDLLAATGNTAEVNEEKENQSWIYSLVGFVLVSLLLTAISWRAQKLKEIERTGKHKKADDEFG